MDQNQLEPRNTLTKLLAIHLQRPIVLVYAQHEHDHDCHLTSRFRLDPKDNEVVSPLVAPSWCRLVMPAGYHIAS